MAPESTHAVGGHGDGAESGEVDHPEHLPPWHQHVREAAGALREDELAGYLPRQALVEAIRGSRGWSGHTETEDQH
jgi:hypothetical protein